MKKTLLTFVCIFSFLALAQSQATLNDLGEMSIRDHSYFSPSAPPLTEFSYVDRLEGTPFLYEDWKAGRIWFAGQSNYSEQVGIVIDLRSHQLYAQTDNGFVGKLPIGKVDHLHLYVEEDTLLMEVHDLQKEYRAGEKGPQYYEVVHRGDRYTVYHGHTKYLRKEDYIENLGMIRRPDEFKSRQVYFLYNGARMTEFSLNQRSLVKAFPERAGAVKTLMKKHDIKLKDTNELAYLFSLLE